MSFICRTGNLAATPVLREGEHGPYCYAPVVVSDRVKNKEGEYEDGPRITYQVAVSGDQARRLVACAERDGNVRVIFAGRYTVTEWTGDKGTRLNHEVRAISVGLSFLGQEAGIVPDTPAEPESEPQQTAERGGEPADIFEEGES